MLNKIYPSCLGYTYIHQRMAASAAAAAVTKNSNNKEKSERINSHEDQDIHIKEHPALNDMKLRACDIEHSMRAMWRC